MISVIIPIYNVMPYLPMCLDSILNQSHRNLEIILVDDGSTDGCPQLCDDYAIKDSRIKVIHKKNGGLSDARNKGVETATGKWIYFVDSDDWLDKDAILKLHQFAIEHDCDVVQENMYYVYRENMLYRKASTRELYKTILDRNDAMRELIINDRVKNFAWGKLYKAELIKDLAFPKGKYFEDSFWQHYVIDKVNRYGIIDEPLYYYRQREDSISGTPSNKIKDLLEGNKQRLDFIQRIYPNLYPIMLQKYEELYDQFYPKRGLKYRINRFLLKIKGRLSPNKYITINI